MATDREAAKFLGKAVEVTRVRLGMKRTELEEKTQLSYAYLSEIEKGRKYPSQAAISKLAAGLGLTSFGLLALAESLERGGSAQDPFASVDGSLGLVVDAPQPMLTAPPDDFGGAGPAPVRSSVGEDLVERVSAQVYRVVEPRMREWLIREIRLAVREELLQQREAR